MDSDGRAGAPEGDRGGQPHRRRRTAAPRRVAGALPRLGQSTTGSESGGPGPRLRRSRTVTQRGGGGSAAGALPLGRPGGPGVRLGVRGGGSAPTPQSNLNSIAQIVCTCVSDSDGQRRSEPRADRRLQAGNSDSDADKWDSEGAAADSNNSDSDKGGGGAAAFKPCARQLRVRRHRVPELES